MGFSLPYSLTALDLGGSQFHGWHGVLQRSNIYKVVGKVSLPSPYASPLPSDQGDHLQKTLARLLEQLEKTSGHLVKNVFLILNGPLVQEHRFRQTHSFSPRPSGKTSPYQEFWRSVFTSPPWNLSANTREGARSPFVPLLFNPLGYQWEGGESLHFPLVTPGGKIRAFCYSLGISCQAWEVFRQVFKQLHIQLIGAGYSGHLSGLSALHEDDKALGAWFIEMGHTHTSLNLFQDGSLRRTYQIPGGGKQLDQDLAQVLGAPLEYATQIKHLYGAVIASQTDFEESIKVPLVGEKPGTFTTVSRDYVVQILRARMEEILEAVRGLIKKHTPPHMLPRVILSGGCVHLLGIRELAQQILEQPIRLGLSAFPSQEEESAPQHHALHGLFQHYSYHPNFSVLCSIFQENLRKKTLFKEGISWLKKFL